MRANQVIVLEDGAVAFCGKPELVATELEQQDQYNQFLPDLWKLRLLIAGDSLPYWKTAGEAQLFLSEYLTAGKVEQSA